MKNLLALIGLVVVSFLGFGWYCGWYTVGSEPGSNGHRKINVDVNTKEFVEDITNVTKGVTPAPAVENKSDSQTPGVHVGPNGNPVIVLPKLEIRTGN